MCAKYGLMYAGGRAALRFNLPPLDRPEQAERIARWVREEGGVARITGRVARNVNPVIVAPEGQRRLEFGWWLLHIANAPARFSAFNSRADRLVARWRRPFQTRALLPASWYVEKGRRFAVADLPVFAMAAITSRSVDEDGDELVTYSLVTRDAVGRALTVHPRMPLILPASLHDAWLDPERPGDDDLVGEALAASDDLSHAARPIDEPVAGDPQRAPTLFPL